jgi:hypothetical protein
MSHYPPLWYACVREAEAEELALPRQRHRILVAVDLQVQLRCEESFDAFHHSLTRPPAANVNITVSSAGESHPDALSDPYVNLAAHTAPVMEPCCAPTASAQTAPNHDAQDARSSVSLCANGHAVSYISNRPTGPKLDPGVASADRAPNDNTVRNVGASPELLD